MPYSDDIWLPASRKKFSDEDLIDKCNASRDDLVNIRDQIEKRLRGKKYQNVPVIIAGDFNLMSHMYYTEVNRDQFQHVVWPTNHVLIDSGFRDSYRETNPTVDRDTDSTWSPKFRRWGRTSLSLKGRFGILEYKMRTGNQVKNDPANRWK